MSGGSCVVFECLQIDSCFYKLYEWLIICKECLKILLLCHQSQIKLL